MARWSDLIYFDGETTYRNNGAGDSIKVPGEPLMIFANKKPVRQSEFYLAGANGMRPEMTFEIRSWDYAGQKVLSHEDKRYRIIRTFDKGEIIELICEGDVDHGTS